MKGTVVCLHGFPDNFHTFEGLGRTLSTAGYKVITPPLRGYKPNDLIDGDLERVADDIFRVINDQTPQGSRVHIIGHDWGSKVASICAIRHPECFRSLTMIAIPHNLDGGIRIYPQQLLNSWYCMFFQLPVLPELWLLRLGGLEYLYRKWSPHFNSPETLASVRRTLTEPGVISSALGYYRHEVGRNSLLLRLIIPMLYPLMVCFVFSFALVRGLLGVGGREGKADVVDPPIQVPVLAISGIEDGCCCSGLFDACMKERPELFPKGLRVERLAHAGHWVHLERPTEVANMILQHVEAA
uniref:AB hydrolase-1 domain-containing protein n=1 Tax=Haptolina ericina TaxID=156174 RepID=A0A7S3C4Q8_9EUKA|eukprot:CAMPEP_0181206734 /NCGR_PEP_ID=MMETSP1096-20121128/21196_1 /TAXON_ID=156174 ORGANISM="Chrysochromulina ericina, Strain CCMP281" /NCGR_SAMPLE_ID=MMETSP1096 /ASSEMBLY_ACC=CAM_ASM_000453 /LENGTH=297 /DNA_ID=CAMNT_0023297659 /DNA_START=40 /DNA_END=933 /DNA_ORIENTATION=-